MSSNMMLLRACGRTNDLTKCLHFQVIDDTIKTETLVNGFRKCGLHPFTPEAINFEEMKVKSNTKEPDPNVQNDTRIEDDIDHQLFVKWIEKAIPSVLLHDFRSSGDGWTGNLEHKSLFELWQKQCDLAATSIQSINARDNNLHVVPYVGIDEQGNSTADQDEHVLIFDYESIPIVDLEEFGQVESEKIVIVDSTQDGQFMSEDGNISEHDNYEQFMEINELEDGAEWMNRTGYDSDYSSSDDEFNAYKSSEPADSDIASDIDGDKCTTTETENIASEEKIVGRCTVSSDAVVPSVKEIRSNVEVERDSAVDSVNTSHIPPGTPAAFAKVLFYPGEQHLSTKSKRLGKKRKVPAVYSSDQYLEYMREKQKEKEERESMIVQRKLKREQEKQRKEDEKKEREAKRLAKKEATAIKNAELAAKKADAAMKRAEEAAKKRDAAAKKASMKEGNSSGATAPKRKKQKIDSSEDN